MINFFQQYLDDNKFVLQEDNWDWDKKRKAIIDEKIRVAALEKQEAARIAEAKRLKQLRKGMTREEIAASKLKMKREEEAALAA